MSETPLLEARRITKGFGGAPVLNEVGFRLQAGEVHVLLGENGAGKSTLTKIISGVYTQDAGEIHLDGRAVQIDSPAAAQARGIALLHQEPRVFPNLDVAENIFLGRQPEAGLPRKIAWKRMYEEAATLLATLGVSLDPRMSMGRLSVAGQQMVEMARALSQKARILILDEPTASLTPAEVADLFRIVAQLRNSGAGIIFISHRLEEVFAIGDRITVLRDGAMVGTVRPAETDRDAVIRMMVGRPINSLFTRTCETFGPVRMEAQGLSRLGEFRDISFDVRSGEIVGLAGLVGAGRTQVADALFGITRMDAGTLRLNGKTVRIRTPQDAVRQGLAYVPEDRQKHGLLLPFSIAQNTTLARLRDFARAGWIRTQQERRTAAQSGARLRLRGVRDMDQAVSELSGGNQQKVSLAKWLLTEPQVLILDEPTRGIDVGAKAEIHRLMDELTRQGMAILMISSELPEILAMSDRILVMREGRITGRFQRGEASQERVMAAATQSVGSE